MKGLSRRSLLSGLAAIPLAAGRSPAVAAQKLRVAKVVPFAWAFTPLDIGIGSGPGMAFSAKGVPAKAVAAMYGLPRNIAVMVGNDSDVKTVNDLKGKKLGVTTVGSLTAWVGQRINEKKGWDGNGIDAVPIGGMPPARAAIQTHQLDGYIGALETGYSLEDAKEWRVITTATEFVDHFITHVIFARDEFFARQPQTVRAFLERR